MNCEIIEVGGGWRAVADAANTTVNREPGTKEPTSAWKRKMLMAEHSPIRLLKVRAKWTDLPSWVSVHFVRHKHGIEHWVRTQRSDRTGVGRDELPQGAPVEHMFEANAQAILSISRKRLCNCASPETRAAWMEFLSRLMIVEQELVAACVPECVYRGFCPEAFNTKCSFFAKGGAAWRDDYSAGY